MRRWRARDSWGGQTSKVHNPGSSERCPHDNEFDAFLAGAYADWLLTRKRSVPAWAWVNKIAHATPDELRLLATRPPPEGASADIVLWHQVTSLLAKEVLITVADDDAQLAWLQHNTLLPLELHLAHHWWATVVPVDLATAVLTAVQHAQLPGRHKKKEHGS